MGEPSGLEEQECTFLVVLFCLLRSADMLIQHRLWTKNSKTLAQSCFTTLKGEHLRATFRPRFLYLTLIPSKTD